MSTEILTLEQQKLLGLMKDLQKEWGSEKKGVRVYPKTVIVHATDLATRMWGQTEYDCTEKVLGMVSNLVAAKIGIRLMRLTQTIENNGQKVTTVGFRYAPVGKEKSQKLIEEQRALGRKRRTIFASDDEWKLAVKAIEDFRNRNQQLPLN